MSVTPICIKGLWTEGYVFDIYVTSSEFCYYDVFGNPHFDNKYSSIGKLLHDMKYRGHNDNGDAIANICSDFLNYWLKDLNIDIILPVPPTQKRNIQPMFLIAEALSSSLNIPCCTDVLEKISEVPAKSMVKESKNLSGTIIQTKPAKRKCNVLLVDDVYDTGSTANECTSVLRSDPLINNIYYFALVHTRTANIPEVIV